MTSRKKWRRSFAAVLAVLALAPMSPAAGFVDEYQVKAAFVFNFSRFVEWPASPADNAGEPFAICILGRNPFGRMLDGIVEGNSIDGRPFAVRQVGDAREAKTCKILFVSSSERLRYRAIVETLRGSTVFSVGDTNDFVAEGGIAGLRLEGGKVRIELNAQAARENNLRISSRLMSLATAK